MPSAASFLNSQFFVNLPYPTKRFTSQTIIVTGSNIRMGLEAARHFVRLDAAKVILAVRSIAKGETTKKSIEESEKLLGVVKVWESDLANYDYMLAFAARARMLERLDVVVANRGRDELTITVNVASTMLLAMLLVPKLRESAVNFGTVPVLTFTGSFTHAQTKFPERETTRIFERLADEKIARMNDRYQVLKLIQLFCVRELANEVSKCIKQELIIISTINPGFVDTSIMREAGFMYSLFVSALKKLMSRTAEEGGRTLVSAAEGREETHGQYLDNYQVGEVSVFVRSDEGLETQKRIWAELSAKLEEIQPGVMSDI
ncbi:putative short-chain dehydrogenase/reductase family protein [Rhexocercosporidium sp. MPI-PUGE-AT-0058]|nr:putative short-chain dehydrogenase/reductase family protein [Rhexocercosporidium sp. MPI-PUGE-AT-0058]